MVDQRWWHETGLFVLVDGSICLEIGVSWEILEAEHLKENISSA